jgi:4-phosphopantoate--beta-alanine ligase
VTRERLVEAVERGLMVKEGLIAHGRGEAFDYILGEVTIPQAVRAEMACAAHLLSAKRPVISVNGNAAALASKTIVELADSLGATIEANIFYGDRGKRIKLIVKELEANGANGVLGLEADARLPGLEGQRALCSREGIHSADVVLVPLEDGDRAQALVDMGKTVVAVDLNPLSRTSRTAQVSIVDELTRAIPEIKRHVEVLRADTVLIEKTIKDFDNEKNIASVLEFIGKRMKEL